MWWYETDFKICLSYISITLEINCLSYIKIKFTLPLGYNECVPGKEVKIYNELDGEVGHTFNLIVSEYNITTSREVVAILTDKVAMSKTKVGFSVYPMSTQEYLNNFCSRYKCSIKEYAFESKYNSVIQRHNETEFDLFTRIVKWNKLFFYFHNDVCSFSIGNKLNSRYVDTRISCYEFVPYIGIVTTIELSEWAKGINVLDWISMDKDIMIITKVEYVNSKKGVKGKIVLQPLKTINNIADNKYPESNYFIFSAKVVSTAENYIQYYIKPTESPEVIRADNLQYTEDVNRYGLKIARDEGELVLVLVSSEWSNPIIISSVSNLENDLDLRSEPKYNLHSYKVGAKTSICFYDNRTLISVKGSNLSLLKKRNRSIAQLSCPELTFNGFGSFTINSNEACINSDRLSVDSSRALLDIKYVMQFEVQEFRMLTKSYIQYAKYNSVLSSNIFIRAARIVYNINKLSVAGDVYKLNCDNLTIMADTIVVGNESCSVNINSKNGVSIRSKQLVVSGSCTLQGALLPGSVKASRKFKKLNRVKAKKLKTTKDEINNCKVRIFDEFEEYVGSEGSSILDGCNVSINGYESHIYNNEAVYNDSKDNLELDISLKEY